MSERPIVIVDLDGPILDVARRYFAAHVRALDETSTTGVHGTLGAFWDAKRRRAKPAEMIEEAERASAYADAFRKVIEDDGLLQLDRVHDGALAALARLARKWDTFVLSLRSNVPGARKEVERLGVAAICPVHFVIHTPVGKASRARQLVGARKVVAVVGDTEADAAVARVVDAPFVAVTSGIRDEAALAEEKPAITVADLASAVAWIEAHA